MENCILNSENILYHLRQNLSDRRNLQLIVLLENIEKHEHRSAAQKCEILGELLQILSVGPINLPDTADDGVIFCCIILVTCLQEQQKLPLFNEIQFAYLWDWLSNQYKYCQCNVNICRILIAFGNMLALHSQNVDKYFVLALHIITKNISPNTSDALLITTLQCLNKILNSLKITKLSDEQSTACSMAGFELLQLHYGEAKLSITSNILVVIDCTLMILDKIVTLSPNFAKQQSAELLGLSKTYFHFGVATSEISLLKPEKIQISQQTLYYSTEENQTVINSEKIRNCGGKAPKTRKPRSVIKTASQSEYKSKNTSLEDRCATLIFDMKVSDSEISDPENASNRVLFERNRNSRIRYAAISLVGSVARVLERKILFGYWHALLPTGPGDSNDNLIYIGQHDPNLRCRSAALQVCALLLYGSKEYLHQAELNVKQCPTTFVPFSVSLGYTVLAIYKSLTTILSSESSLPVLTQSLKCLAALVQASPFKQFENGFVQNFVKNVKPLVYHRNATIQVSALMVMEFLLAQPETTWDIAEAIGIPREATNNRSKLERVKDDEIDVDIEEFVECEEDSFVERRSDGSTKQELRNTQTVEESSWLLRRVFHNLSKHDQIIPTSVRVESLQVLTVMSSKFAIIQPHLTKISEVLLYSLKDVLPDVRLHAARCVDTCAYQISRYLLDNTSCSEAKVRECNIFWVNIMPSIMSQIPRNSEEVTTVRIALCDALSNIGDHMFENTPHSNQIRLLSFLSGVSSDESEETIVRAAGARALAVFALYPSMRRDLVFIENTANVTLRLVKDSNLLVRVKSFWSLGNISDALIGKETDTDQLRQERISEDLLFRLITAASEACSDNDKVRCNAVRTLGNLLRLLNEEHLNNENSKFSWRHIFVKSVSKLSDCIRSSGNAKVKWNTCYVISNLMRNQIIFKMSDLSWQETLFSALCLVIVHHSNFKVRINASAAIINITERTHFGAYYEMFWSALLEAIEQSYNLDNFYEYNHRDNLQEQLCLSLSHIIKLSSVDDLPMLKKHLMLRAEIIHNTWKRVVNRVVPEKAAPLLSCPVVLLEREKDQLLALEQRKVLEFLAEVFNTE